LKTSAKKIPGEYVSSFNQEILVMSHTDSPIFTAWKIFVLANDAIIPARVNRNNSPKAAQQPRRPAY
jgi:hypothetical protein